MTCACTPDASVVLYVPEACPILQTDVVESTVGSSMRVHLIPVLDKLAQSEEKLFVHDEVSHVVLNTVCFTLFGKMWLGCAPAAVRCWSGVTQVHTQHINNPWQTCRDFCMCPDRSSPKRFIRLLVVYQPSLAPQR